MSGVCWLRRDQGDVDDRCEHGNDWFDCPTCDAEAAAWLDHLDAADLAGYDPWGD